VNQNEALKAMVFGGVQLLVARIERRAPRLDPSAYPYLPQATVMTTAASDYTVLLTGVVEKAEFWRRR
jgi:hypothetical protein